MQSLRGRIDLPISTRSLITFLLLAIIVVLSIAPGQAQYGDTAFSWLVIVTPTPLQKMLHVLIYAALAFMLVWTLERVGARAARYLLAFATAVGLGILLEWIQTTVPGRFGSLTDVLLNALGVVIGLILAHLSGLVDTNPSRAPSLLQHSNDR